MAETSKRLRRARKLKRANSLLFRALTKMTAQRDYLRDLLLNLQDKAIETQKAKAARDKALTIRTLSDDPTDIFDPTPPTINGSGRGSGKTETLRFSTEHPNEANTPKEAEVVDEPLPKDSL